MKNKLLLSILAAFGLAGASSQAQTVTFVDVATSGDYVRIETGTGASTAVDATVLTRSQRWTKDKVYILARNVIVPSGVTLTIEPGTLIRAERPSKGQGASGAEAALSPADPGALVVARGGRIIAAGTSDAPIIFTTMDDPNVPGGAATIPAYENYAITNGIGSGIVANRTQLRTWDVATGTPGQGEYTLRGGAPIAGAVNSYTNDITSAQSYWAIDGKWGGIVLAGYAEVVMNIANNTSALTTSINNGTINVSNGNLSGPSGVQLIEGMASFPVYSLGGGDNDNDDSGILRFIDLRYGGYVIAADKELNSYSFYGVGKNTVAEFLADWNNADDSYELWGGALNLRHCVSAFPGDDGLDTDQGYLGTVQFFVQLQNNAVDASGNTSARATVNIGDSMSENDGPESGNSAVPYSVYTLANATFVGRGYNVIAERTSANGYSLIEPATGPNYKDNGSAKVYNSIFMDSPHGAMMIMDRRSVGDTGNIGSGGNSAINRFYVARSSGGFDAAGRAADLVTTNNGAAAAPDGLFNNVWFFRCGLLDTSIAGIDGKYASLSELNADKATNSNWWVANGTNNLFPDRTDRSQRGSNGNGNSFRANPAALITVITNSPGVKFDQDPGLSVPYNHRLSGIDLRVTTASARDLTNSAIPTNYGSGNRKLNADATYVGAVRDNSWFRGWNFASQSGIFANTAQAIVPNVVISVDANNRPVVTYGAEANVKYTIEASADNKGYAPVRTESSGTAGNKSWTDTNNTVGTAPLFYRVIAL